MRFYTKEDIIRFDEVNFLYIKTLSEGNIFRIRLSRSEKRNAFTPVMAEEIIYALAYAHYSSEIRCVIIEAEGPVFCAGADLVSFHHPESNPVNHTLPGIREEAKLGDAFQQLYKPCIAKVEGPVLAGGFLILCGCTFVVSVEKATFGLPEVKRGLWPMQVMASLLRITTPRKILEMAVTGNLYSAHEAKEIGLVTEIVTHDIISEKVDALANLICQNAPLAIQKGMQALDELSDISRVQQHSFLKQQLDILLQTEDAKEGTSAFAEKRNPVWKGK